MSEYGRWDPAARNFRNPNKFRLSPREISDPYGREHTKFFPFSSLPNSLIRDFHFIDTAIYNLGVLSPEIEDVFDEVWRTWYPRRNLTIRANESTWGFFCRVLKPGRGIGEVSIQDIALFHEELIQTIDAHQESQGDRSLDISFRKVFVALDKEDWEKDGILMVCREESVADFGLKEYGEGEIGKGEEERVLEGGWICFRKGLVEAVKLVINDPERKKAGAPVQKQFMEKRLRDGL